jgi:protein TonB
MRVPTLPAIALSLLLHAGAVLLALSGVSAHVQQRPEPVPIAVTLIAPEPPAAAPVVQQAAPPEPPPPRPRPEPVPRPAPVKPRPAPVARPKPIAPSPRPEPPARAQEPAVATAPAAEPPVAAAPAAPPAPPPAPVRTGVSISASYAASNRPPVQPARSLRNNEEGKVVLRVLVQADGSAGEVQVRSSSGFPLLDEAARSAVQTWRFNPATSDGKPVAEWYLVPIIFKLSN